MEQSADSQARRRLLCCYRTQLLGQVQLVVASEDLRQAVHEVPAGRRAEFLHEGLEQVGDFDPHGVRRVCGDRVATHIYDSHHKPETTFPKKDGKVIPGWIWGDTFRPLHRNWSKWDAAAEELARPGPGPTYQCDEFLFASTMVGAGCR